MTRSIDIEALCAEKGLRITEQRKVIARVLGESEDHPDVEALHARAAAVDPGSRKRASSSATISATAAPATKPRRKLITTI
jgi:Fe2+ or Zn2+ uptake regulation protein